MSRDAAVVHWDEEERVWVYRASGLGSCLGALVRARLGVDGDPPPDWLQDRMDEGTDWETRVLDEVGLELLSAQDLEDIYEIEVDEYGQITVEVPAGKGVVIRSHPDGVMKDAVGELYAVEAKFTSSQYAKTVIRDMPLLYQWQASVEAAGFARLVKEKVREIAYVVAEKVRGEDGEVEGIGEVHHWMYRPPFSMLDLVQRVRKVEKYAAEGTVPDCEYAQYPCPWWRDHDPDDPMWRESEVEVPENRREVLVELARNYRIAAAGEKASKEAKVQIGKDIAAIWDEMGAKGGKTKLEDDEGRKIRVVDVVQKRRGGVDEDAMVKDGVDVEKYRKAGYEVRYPKIEIED